ncbi:MAG TPA: hypothetical protein VHM67_01110 [Gemmatimonadaceae bacterium]|nr:hypothetical protein [Gemmatimonadaceae bacterium]
MQSRITSIVALSALVAAAGCGGAGSQQGAGGAPAPANPSGVQTTADAPWPVKTREHLDLWLHGFAIITQDTTRVPLFRRGYRDQMTVEKNRRGITTLLDQNREQLAARLTVNRNLVGAQFIALYFGSWEELARGISIFLQAGGDPGRARDAQQQAVIAFLAGTFQSQADRTWLELFARAIEDERSRFYHEYWLAEQRTRGPALAAVDSLWQRIYRPRMQVFLDRTQQGNGDFILSLPLDGEGRTITAGKRSNVVAVSFPDDRSRAVEAIYVAAHEVIGAIANTAIADNVTPAERREGLADRISANALVRGGALLLQRVSPDLADGYARYYLRAAGASATGDVQAALAQQFPLPERVRTSIASQLETVLGGI